MEKPDNKSGYLVDLATVLRRIDELGTRWNTEPVPVGLNRQVFYDDSGLSYRSDDVVRRIARADKRGEAIAADQDWEGGRVGVYFSVVRDVSGLFKAWYRAGSGPSGYGSLRVAYAESWDGASWEKPISFPATDNVVLSGGYSVGVTYNPDDPAGHPYLAAYGRRGQPGIRAAHGLFFSYSEDGRRWRPVTGPSLGNEVRSDTLNTVWWDAAIGAYRVYSRTFSAGGRSSRQYILAGLHSGGAPARAESAMGSRPIAHISDAGSPHRSIGSFYSFNAYPFQGYYIANIALYRKREETIDYCLALSRDGRDWDLSWVGLEHALVERGGAGDPDEFIAYPCGNPPIPEGDEFYLYYSGSRQNHAGHPPLPQGKTRYSIMRATVRRDGLWYLENAGKTGEVETKTFILEGNALIVNADASRTDLQSAEGALRVEVLDSDGTPMPGFSAAEAVPILSDGVNITVQWRDGADMASLMGREIRLRFVLEGPVRLYAYQVVARYDPT